MGTWFGEYDGSFTVREFFIRQDDLTVVAPFDMPFRGPDHSEEPPEIEGIARISLQELEALWEQFAQPRLHMFAMDPPALADEVSIQYFRSPCPAEINSPEASSDIFTEYAASVARRSFEVFADHTLVGPYDVGLPEVDGDEMLRFVHDIQDPDEESIDSRLRPVVLRHAQFEALWEKLAIPRLRVLADNSLNSKDG